MTKHPRVSIVTPVYNRKKYLETCILSIMRQTYDNVEHIIVDGGSTDGTLDVIKKYEGKYNMRWISEKDNGMYDAISKGFSMATGEIFAWINSDDMYLPWACEVAAEVMSQTNVRWLTGIPQQYTERGVGHHIPRLTPVYPRKFLEKGYMDNRVCDFVQQESTFWSRELWQQHGSVATAYKIAGDYHLWRCFAKTEKLVTVDCVLSGIRVHDGQLSKDNRTYYREVGSLSMVGKFLQKTHILKIVCLFLALTSNTLRLKLRTLSGFDGGDTCKPCE